MNKSDPSGPGSVGMLRSVVPAAKSNRIGLSAATDAPGTLPSTLPKEPEPPGALSWAYEVANRREWSWHGHGHGSRRGLMAGRAPSGRCSATRNCPRAILGAFERESIIPERWARK